MRSCAAVHARFGLFAFISAVVNESEAGVVVNLDTKTNLRYGDRLTLRVGTSESLVRATY